MILPHYNLIDAVICVSPCIIPTKAGILNLYCAMGPFESDEPCGSRRKKVPYILESNPHPFYSFRGLKNQMRIRIASGLDSRSRAGFWKNDRAAVRAVRTIQ